MQYGLSNCMLDMQFKKLKLHVHELHFFLMVLVGLLGSTAACEHADVVNVDLVAGRAQVEGGLGRAARLCLELVNLNEQALEITSRDDSRRGVSVCRAFLEQVKVGLDVSRIDRADEIDLASSCLAIITSSCFILK